MSRYTQLLLIAFIALFFVQLNEALPAPESSLEARWEQPYYYCCYYYYKSDKRGLERRWENKCEEYQPSKRNLAERNDELEKRWGKPDYYCCYYYYDQNSKKRDLDERNNNLEARWNNNCKVYKNNSKRDNEKRWDQCEPQKRGLEKRWDPYCCCYEY
ncbi:10286_t:CDS:1 [Paraglomus occultum]|uniref:10286_t:CDS:1 n=1 Tax=Paraglomus occultum TaxID=144539 RepID=A0A9N9CC53_9GLOM|nr:10286_t:CDS:1 [Paraglomus occultum]